MTLIDKLRAADVRIQTHLFLLCLTSLLIGALSILLLYELEQAKYWDAALLLFLIALNGWSFTSTLSVLLTALEGESA